MSTVVFMGTPDFAEGILKGLIDSDFQVIGVFTQPDRPKGRKGILQAPPVKTCAQEHGIPVWQPEKIRSEENVRILQELSPDFIAVAAFGQIIPQAILDIPRFGCLNVHASLLPRWRGAAPIQWSILEGDRETGVTIMRMNAGLDTGDIIEEISVPIAADETGGSLFDKLMETGSAMLPETMRRIEAGQAVYTPQPADSPTPYAKMLGRQDGCIDWSMSAEALERRVRGLSPWPGTFTSLPDGKMLKIWSARIPENGGAQECTECAAAAGDGAAPAPGTILGLTGDAIRVQTGTGPLDLTEVQPEGKKRMRAADYLRGARLRQGDRLGSDQGGEQ